MSFLAPGRLWLLVLVAAVAAAYVILQRRRRQYAMRFTNLDLLASVAPRRPGWRRHVATGLLVASLAMLVVGFARPTRPRRVPREQATVILAIDVSLSMEASDVAPTRLVAAQQAARSFVEQLPARFRVGLISFDGTARVLVGPTEDHTAVSQGIDALQLGPRTAAGEAVFTALETIASSVQGTVGTPPPARIVLMSDGATTSGRSIDDAAAAAKQAGVPVSTIAFGTDSGSVTVSGRDVPVPVDRVAMKALADESGGRFFEAASGDQLRSVYRDIGSSIGYRTVRQENTATFTGFALVLVAAGVVAGLVWTGRVL